VVRKGCDLVRGGAIPSGYGPATAFCRLPRPRS